MKSRGWIALLVLAAAGAVAWRRCRAGDDPAADTAHAEEGEAAGGHAAVTETPILPGIGPHVAPVRTATVLSPPSFDAGEQHTADPCTVMSTAVIPAGYETLTVDGITLAWAAADVLRGTHDAPLRPPVLVRLAAGILEEAAQLLGSERRAELTVIVDATSEDYHAKTRAPAWSSGFYDGAAVRLFASPGDDVGLALATLRHELMHAQLHAAIGCMPTWFNEGMAMYFAGTPMVSEWLDMLHDREMFEHGALATPTLDGMRSERVTRAYAQSLAMVVYLLEHGGEPALLRAANQLRGRPRAEALALWDRIHPEDVSPRAVLDTLAQKLFGLSFGAELDRTLAGPICCSGLRVIGELACRAGTPLGGRKVWIDRTTTPNAHCQTQW
ncbi:MAG: hypothetical protein KF773_16305 [Deltaproteobacteria bacterium]|nr:hypothetical protein [Deltaproteobacteria bacterium]